MMNLKVNDRVVRFMPGFRNEIWRNEGFVLEIKGQVITCLIQVDIQRAMQFDINTGVHLAGREYGWIEAAK